MKASFFLILWFCNITYVHGQQKTLFDLTQILFDIPKDALPPSNEELDSAMSSYFNSHNHYFKETEIQSPNDTAVETHYSQFHLKGNLGEKEGFYFEFKIYLTQKDTLLLSIYRSHEELEAGNANTPPKVRISLIVKAFKVKGLKEFDEIPLPEVKPTDFAKTPNDSLIIASQYQNHDVNFFAHFENQSQVKGIYFGLHDTTLRRGPFEPPVTTAPKYFSDYETIDRQICFLVTSQGIIYER
jgi:hypothetical protein